MEKSIELMKHSNGQHSLVLWLREREGDGGLEVINIVVCSYYDPTKEFGSQWCWGHYFGKDGLQEAINYLNEQ